MLKIGMNIRKWLQTTSCYAIGVFNGNSEYKKYLRHFNEHHPKQTPLTKQQFFAKKEQEKWSKINRCC
jgi:uncharacterized short protein YbdD (DUF466 family)